MCSTLTMGEMCLEHEEPVVRTFARGKPFRRTVVQARVRQVVARAPRPVAS
jgi:hypothetical protein